MNVLRLLAENITEHETDKSYRNFNKNTSAFTQEDINHLTLVSNIARGVIKGKRCIHQHTATKATVKAKQPRLQPRLLHTAV